MRRQVVITGIGPVTSAGTGVDKFAEVVFGAKPVPSTHIPGAFEAGYRFGSKYYIPLPACDLKAHGLDITGETAMQQEDRMTVLAALLALEDAGYERTASETGYAFKGTADCDLIIGTGITGLESSFLSYLAHNGIGDLALIGRPPLKIKFNRMIVPQTMTNSPAAWTSIVFGLTGASQTVNASCASGTVAIGEAFRRIRDGYSEMVIAGGVENLHESTGVIMRGFDMLGTLTRSNEGRCYPFSKRRDGFLYSEGGACVVAVEELTHALKRGARIYAEIAGYHSNSDAATIVQMDRSGTRVRKLLGKLAENGTIDYCNAHGTGTELNDGVEAEAIGAMFAKPPLVNSTKSLIGHTLGASGAIEAAVTALSVYRGMVHGMDVPEPLDNVRIARSTVEMRIESAISVSFGFGGHNAGLFMKRFDHE